MRACSGPLAALLLVGSLAACSSTVPGEDARVAGEVVTGLTVSGDPGRTPVVRMRTPLAIDETTSAVTVEGTGAPVQVDRLFVVEISIFDARTGKASVSRLALAAKTTDDQLFPKLSDALVGVRQGSRLVLAATAADAFAAGGVPPQGVDRSDPVVVVADVVAVPPTKVLKSADGLPAAYVAGTPELSSPDGVPTTVNFDQVRTEPQQPQKYLLMGGTGPKVRPRSLITVDYLGQEWRRPDPFESTYFKEPEEVAIGTATAPAGWDDLLVGVPRGSRVMIVEPAGNDVAHHGTIVWVVDVLGVS